MFFGNDQLLLCCEAQVVSIDTLRIAIFFHFDDVDLSQCVSCFERHHVVEFLGNKDLLVIVFTKGLKLVSIL